MACIGLAPVALNASVAEQVWNAGRHSDSGIAKKSHELAQYYVGYYLRCKLAQHELKGLPKSYVVPAEVPCEEAALLSRLCLEMEQTNWHFFHSLPERLSLSADNAFGVFTEVAKQAFNDGNYNWGRVVSLFTLAGVIALHFTKNAELDTAVKVAGWLNCFIQENLSLWIKSQGGWDGLNSHYSGGILPAWSRFVTLGGICAAAGFMLFSGLSR